MRKFLSLVSMIVALTLVAVGCDQSPTNPDPTPTPPQPTATVGAAINWSVPVTLNKAGTYNLFLGCGTEPANFGGGPASLMLVGQGSYQLTETPPGATSICGNIRSVMVMTTGAGYKEEVFSVPGTFPGSP